MRHRKKRRKRLHCTILEDLSCQPVNRIIDHHDCPLGRWLKRAEVQSKLPRRLLKEIAWWHEQVHASAMEVVWMRRRGKGWGSLESMNRFKTVWDRLNRELERTRGTTPAMLPPDHVRETRDCHE
ncbi:MAG: CZB domain-containing protein [Magnetococcales bacterium]|nr:CZB domain-containing protein [Magnetococcales bacterium]